MPVPHHQLLYLHLLKCLVTTNLLITNCLFFCQIFGVFWVPSVAVFEVTLLFCWFKKLPSFSFYVISLASVLWHFSFGIRKSIWLVKIWVMRSWHGYMYWASEVQLFCLWSSWCHCQLVIYCFIKIQIDLIFLVLAYPGCPGKEPAKWVFPLFLWSPCVMYYIFVLWFLLSFFFFPRRRKLDVYHTSTHDVALVQI